jgi:pimeloyl-ACP methyl ester carboxylesterase
MGWSGSAESLSEWHQFFIEYEPLPAAVIVRCPVLILHGDQDKHVPVEYTNMIGEAIPRSGNQDVAGVQAPHYVVKTPIIEIGEGLAAFALSHHPAYGSVPGDSHSLG